MESNDENDFPAETCKGTEDRQCEAEKIACFKNRTCDHPQHTATDASNLLGASSSFSHKSESTKFPLTKETFIGNNSQNSSLPHPHAESGCEFFSHGDSKGLEENSSSGNDCSVERVGSSLVGSVTNSSIDEWKSSALDSANILPNNLETPLQSLTTEGSDMGEDDIKVCDICGDAGREEMLAICSRCCDGAEHTYCMQLMLDKVPEQDWLCEECQLKENAEKQELDKMKTVTGTLKEPSLKEKVFEGTLNPELAPKLDAKVDEVEANKASRVPENSLLSVDRHADYHEDSLKSRKLATETTAGVSGMISSQKNPSLSIENSSKSMNEGKLEQANMVPSSCNQPTDNSNEVSCSPGTMDQMQAQSKPPRDLSRSSTFNSVCTKPKVKQPLEDALQKQELGSKTSSIVTRKEGLTTKSLSFRRPSSGHSNSFESSAKMQPSNLSNVKDPRCLKEAKGQPLLERKNSSKLDPYVVSSPTAGTSLPLSKAYPKNPFCGERMSSFSSENNAREPSTPQCNGKLITCNSTISFSNIESERALVSDGCDEVKKQSCFSSHLRVPISKGKSNSSERKPYQVGLMGDQAASSYVADEPCASPDAVLQGNNIRCQKCGEVGHFSQFCTASSVHVSAVKASAASSEEISNKSSKCKDAVEDNSRSRIKGLRLPGQSDKLFMSSTGLNGKVASKGQLSHSLSSVRSFPSLEGTPDFQEALPSSISDSSRTTATVHVKQEAVHSIETVCAPREVNSNDFSNSEEIKLKSYTVEMSTQALVAENCLRISAIPEQDYIWEGGFTVQRSGRLANYYDGIQAHMSTCSSQSVTEVVKKFPCKVQLEEVPRLSLWPTQLKWKATEENIALYFFAKDLQSYERSYKKLLDNMLKNDLALKGNVDGIELLIFPSNQLPEKSQYWNRLFFLWAVFREKRETCSKSPSDSSKKLYGTNLNVEPSFKGLAVDDINKSQKVSQFGQNDKELSMYDSLPKVPEAVNSNTVDLPSSSSSQKRDQIFYAEALSLSERPIDFHKHNQSAIEDAHLFQKQAVCSIPRIHPSDYVTQLPSLHNACSLSSVSVTNPQMPEVKGNSTSLKEVYKDSKSIKDAQLQPCVQPTTVQNEVKGEVVKLDTDTSPCKQAVLSSSAADGQESSSFSSEMLPVGTSSLPEEAWSQERLSLINNLTSLEVERWEKAIDEKQSFCELSSSRKRLPSNIPDAVSENSGESLKEPIQTIAWKEKQCLQVDGRINCKKMRSSSDVNICCSSCEQIIGDGFSPKILGLELDHNSMHREQKNVYTCDGSSILENSRTTERCLFPADPGHVRDLKLGNAIPWQMPSSNDEELPGIDIPNLELALGAEKKQPKQGALPLFGQLRSDKSSQNKLIDHATGDDGDVLSASLSLSLSFPSSDKEQPSKSVSKTEHLLPKRHHVNTSATLWWL